MTTLATGFREGRLSQPSRPRSLVDGAADVLWPRLLGGSVERVGRAGDEEMFRCGGVGGAGTGAVLAMGGGTREPLAVGEMCAGEGKVMTALPLTTVGAPAVVAGCPVHEVWARGVHTVCVAGPRDFRMILEGRAVTGAAAPDACTICTAAAAPSTAVTGIIVHLVRMPQF